MKMAGLSGRLQARAAAVAAGVAAVALLGAGPAARAEDDCSFVSQMVPASMNTGAGAVVSLTFMNKGTNSWSSAGGYVLAAPNPVVSSTWAVSEIALPSPVATGSSVTFSFRVTAPTAPGAYSFQWQLRRGTTFFGAASTNVSIKVVAPPST